MFTIEKKDEKFVLLKDGEFIGEFIGEFCTLEDAEKAKTVAESNTGTWVDDGKGVEYPEGTDGVHSGDEKLSGEARIDALCYFLRDKHGIHVPYDIAPKE